MLSQNHATPLYIMKDRIPKGVKDALLISGLTKRRAMRVSLATATLPLLSTSDTPTVAFSVHIEIMRVFSVGDLTLNPM